MGAVPGGTGELYAEVTEWAREDGTARPTSGSATKATSDDRESTIGSKTEFDQTVDNVRRSRVPTMLYLSTPTESLADRPTAF